MMFKDIMADYQKTVEDYLKTLFTADAPQKQLFDAMRYSLLAGGKRIPPDSDAGVLRRVRGRYGKGAALCGGHRDGAYLQPHPR